MVMTPKEKKKPKKRKKLNLEKELKQKKKNQQLWVLTIGKHQRIYLKHYWKKKMIHIKKKKQRISRKLTIMNFSRSELNILKSILEIVNLMFLLIDKKKNKIKNYIQRLKNSLKPDSKSIIGKDPILLVLWTKIN